jgi:hypothetical protein
MKEINQDKQVCNCCGGTLSWREINQKSRELFYSYDGDYYKYHNSYKEYNCDACVRNKKICEILKEH